MQCTVQPPCLLNLSRGQERLTYRRSVPAQLLFIPYYQPAHLPAQFPCASRRASFPWLKNTDCSGALPQHEACPKYKLPTCRPSSLRERERRARRAAPGS